ncbi:hypothetical protein [Edaphobacter aggregans]|uniref:hypothetical protein n=1 Tax=Edaphobacter aggregans TaxID=570835 RepID=UPI000550C1D2|nr:hypothetical protein [Edaphobacter aggregans]
MRSGLLGCTIAVSLLSAGLLASAQQTKQDPLAQAIVRNAVQTELAADRDDHSRWRYRSTVTKPEGTFVYAVVETDHGSVKKKIQQDGRPLDSARLNEEMQRIESFVHDPSQQARQRKDSQQDDKRAENMLRLLPDAFLWTVKNDGADGIALAFTPDPNFDAPSMEARVFASMAGEIVVSKPGNRILNIKGRLIREVKFAYGLFGHLDEGGTFNVKRSQLAPGIWQITESHIHITGRALIFKSIGEQEDEVKTDFRPTPPATTLEQAANLLRGEPTALAAQR